MKTKLTIAPAILFSALLLTLSPLKLLSQFTVNITGTSPVAPGSQETYYANFNYTPDPLTIISWGVTTGTIISQNINPTAGSIYCTVEWGSSYASGMVSIYDDLQGVSGEKAVDICAQHDCGPPRTICSGQCTLIGSPGAPGGSY